MAHKMSAPFFLQNFQSILPDVSYKMNFLGLLVNPGFIGGSKCSETLKLLDHPMEQ
jgi:hypothetical protein